MIIKHGWMECVSSRIEPSGQHPFRCGGIETIPKYEIAWKRAISIQICPNFLLFSLISLFFCLFNPTISAWCTLSEYNAIESEGATAYLFTRYCHMDYKLDVGAWKFRLHHAILRYFFFLILIKLYTCIPYASNSLYSFHISIDLSLPPCYNAYIFKYMQYDKTIVSAEFQCLGLKRHG